MGIGVSSAPKGALAGGTVIFPPLYREISLAGRPPRAKKPAMNLASVRAPRTMLAGSTASSAAWMFRAAGPLATAGLPNWLRREMMHRIDRAVRCPGVLACPRSRFPPTAGRRRRAASRHASTAAQDGAAVALIDRSWSRDLIVVAGHVILV